MLIPRYYKLLNRREIIDVRNYYIKLQKGKCWYCSKKLDRKPSRKVRKSYINERLFPKTMFKYPIHLHHSHKTGLTIGAVHCECNAYMWQYERQ